MSKTFGIAFTVGAALAPSVSSVFSTVEQKIKAGASRMEALTARARAFKTAAAADASRKELGRLFAASGGRDPLIKEQLFKAQAIYSKARAAAEKYGMAVGGYAAAHARATAEIAKTESALGRLNAQKQATEKRRELRQRMLDSVAPVVSMALPVRSAIVFESAMADAAKTIDGMRDDSGALTKEYYAMESAVKRMGRQLPLTHEELAKIFAAGGQMGMQTAAELEEFTTMAAHMSVAFGVSTEEAAEAIGGYRTAMKLSFDDTRNMLDLMNQFANTSSASEKGISEIVRRIGPLGNVAGVAYKPMTALAATLDSMKVAPEIAATGIKNMLLALTSGTAATAKQRSALARLGLNSGEIAKEMQKDAQSAIIKVMERVQKLPKHQQLSILKEMFGSESIGAIAPLLDSLDLVKENMRISGDQTAYAGAMQKEFENRNKTTENSLILLKNRVNELGINLGSVLLPPLVTVVGVIGSGVSAVADFAKEHQTLTTAVMGAAIGYTAFKTGALAAAYGATFFQGALIKLPVLMRAVGLAAHAMLGPIGIVTAGVALAAGYIVQNWETVGPYFSGLWDDITGAFSDFGEAFGAAIDTVIITPLKAVIGMFETIYEWVTTLPKIGDSIKSVGDKVGGFVGDGVSGLKKMFGFGDDEKKPETNAPKSEAALPAQTAAVPPAKAASAPQAAPSAALPPTAGVVPPRPTAIERQAARESSRAVDAEGGKKSTSKKTDVSPASAPSLTVNASFSFALNGIPDAPFANRVVTALNDKKADVERLISDIVNNQIRLAYGD